MSNEWDVVAMNSLEELNALRSRIRDASDLTVYPDGTYVMPRMAVGRYALVPISDEGDAVLDTSAPLFFNKVGSLLEDNKRLRGFLDHICKNTPWDIGVRDMCKAALNGEEVPKGT